MGGKLPEVMISIHSTLMIGGYIPDTMPMLTSTAVQVDEPMKSHVTSVDWVWNSCVAMM